MNRDVVDVATAISSLIIPVSVVVGFDADVVRPEAFSDITRPLLCFLNAYLILYNRVIDNKLKN